MLWLVALALCVHAVVVLSLDISAQRRVVCINAIAAAALPDACRAEAAPNVTDLVTLELSIGPETKADLELELYGDAAPASVRSLVAFARGELKAPCVEQPDLDAVVLSTKAKMQQLKLARQCLDDQGLDVSLVGSSVWRVVPGRRIDFGRVASRFASRNPPQLPVESTNLRHKRGAVSVRKGGGCFEFTVTPADNQYLDREDLVVIGRVSDATLPTLDVLNLLPTKRGAFDIGDNPSVPPLGANFARACEYGSPDATCAQYKPLRKVLITRVAVAKTRGGRD